jgi:hypothetical protein
MKKNILDYFSIKSTLDELIKFGEIEIANNLLDIINLNELPKPEKQNLKKDITTSYFEINLSSEIIDKIIDLFSELEVKSLTENGESTNSTNHYVELLDKWLKIQDEQN